MLFPFRIVPVVLALLVLAPAVAPRAEALPGDTYAGAGLGVSVGRPDPYSGFEDYAVCAGPATMQVQRNSVGTWDVVIRRGPVAPSVTPNYPLQTNLNSIQRCPVESAGVFVVTGATGSPSQGITKTSGTASYGWSLRVDPFAMGGPGTLRYETHCSQFVCGVGYAWELTVGSPAMV